MTFLLAPATLPYDQAELTSICEQFHVKELALFGSTVMGSATPDSDIDILVEFAPAFRTGILKFQSLSDALENLFQRKVDLVPKAGLKPWLREQILGEARLVYQA
jgi:uncharacterized protein